MSQRSPPSPTNYMQARSTRQQLAAVPGRGDALLLLLLLLPMLRAHKAEETPCCGPKAEETPCCCCCCCCCCRGDALRLRLLLALLKLLALLMLLLSSLRCPVWEAPEQTSPSPLKMTQGEAAHKRTAA